RRGAHRCILGGGNSAGTRARVDFMMHGRWACLVLLIAALGVGDRARAATEPKVDFNRDVRPLLSEYCFTCHGPDDAKRKAGLRLDLQESALKPAKSGRAAIVPGDAERSELLKRVTTEDEDDHMPPAKTGKRLSA